MENTSWNVFLLFIRVKIYHIVLLIQIKHEEDKVLEFGNLIKKYLVIVVRILTFPVIIFCDILLIL